MGSVACARTLERKDTGIAKAWKDHAEGKWALCLDAVTIVSMLHAQREKEQHCTPR